jgi:dolichol-phosphate mannosyltransferase
VIVVDDGSRDGTPEAVEAIARNDPRVRLIRRAAPNGLATAIREGVEAARGELIGWMDADMIITASDVRRLCAAVTDGAEVAVASRFSPGGPIKGQTREGRRGRLMALRNLRTTEDSWLGVALSWGLNVLILPPLVGLGVHDYTSGIIVARREALDGFEFPGDHGEYFIALWADLVGRGVRVVEVGYKIQPRRFGRSKTANELADYVRRGRLYLRAGWAARSTRNR